MLYVASRKRPKDLRNVEILVHYATLVRNVQVSTSDHAM